MNRLTKQEITKAIYQINWSAIQSDSAAEAAKLDFLMNTLMDIEQKEAIRILFNVIEAKSQPKK